jgi:small conductance mechanosensitive channel
VAGGFLILFSKPLKVGDYVEFAGITGTVESIAILQTKLRRPDGTAVFIPNGKISDAVVLNYSEDPRRRLDLEFSIAYDADAEKAKDLLTAIVLKSPYVLKDESPVIRIGGLGDSAVTLHVRVWTEHAHYWDLHYDLHEQVKAAFDKHGIQIPYPQMDVHLADATK